nr:EfeM/EfeO family lipoprotein [Actinomycetota bacterium]
FEGMIGLANEIASKKISSEEETYSDQSLLIFRHNWEGIRTQFEPFAGEVEKREARAAAEVEDAHRSAMALIEPYFAQGGVAAKPYSSVGTGERGRIVKASYRLRDALQKASEVLDLA